MAPPARRVRTRPQLASTGAILAVLIIGAGCRNAAGSASTTSAFFETTTAAVASTTTTAHLDSYSGQKVCEVAAEFKRVDAGLGDSLLHSGRTIDIIGVDWRHLIGLLRLASSDQEDSDEAADFRSATLLIERAEIGLLGSAWTAEVKDAGRALRAHLASACNVALSSTGFLESGIESGPPH